MEVYNRYEVALYNLSVLTLRKKYRRVIRIAEHIMHQGVVTNELVVILAYAYSQLNDNDKAIQLLNGKQGPLVFVAKAQFCARKYLYEEANRLLYPLLDTVRPGLIDCLSQNNNLLKYRTQYYLIDYGQTLDRVKFVSDMKTDQLLKDINLITAKYEEIKEQKSEENYRYRKRELAKQYRSICYRVTGRPMIQNLLAGYIRFLDDS